MKGAQQKSQRTEEEAYDKGIVISLWLIAVEIHNRKLAYCQRIMLKHLTTNTYFIGIWHAGLSSLSTCRRQYNIQRFLFSPITMYISMHSRQSDITVRNYSNLLYSGRWHDTEISRCHVFISLFEQRSCCKGNYFYIDTVEKCCAKKMGFRVQSNKEALTNGTEVKLLEPTELITTEFPAESLAWYLQV